VTNQLYVFQGIDVQKTKDDAIAKSRAGTTVVLHYHGEPRKCNGFKHEHYHDGLVIDRWGEQDASALPPREGEIPDGKTTAA